MTWSHREFEKLASVVAVRTGLEFSPSRIDSAEQGMRRALGRAPGYDLARYCELIELDPAALDDLVNELTVAETYFFRDAEQFAWIRQHWITDVVHRRGAHAPIRIWSAGCASGEEVYSLAVVCEEAGLLQRVSCLATDISRAALARARRAVYGTWSLRGEGKLSIEPYLTRQGNSYAVDERIREAVAFSYLNLAQDGYPSLAAGFWDLDLILCRNVLIYLRGETIRQVGRRLFEALTPGGWLVTAPSDPPLAAAAPFETVMTSAGVVYRRPGVSGNRAAPLVLPTRDLPSMEESVPRAAEPPALERSAAAASALARGDYEQAAWLARDAGADVDLSILHVRALANQHRAAAERECRAATARHPQTVELRLLHALLLLDLHAEEEAAESVRQLLYLDRTLAIGHFIQGTIQLRQGKLANARRAFRNTRALCLGRPADEAVPLATGETAGRLAEAAAAQLAALDGMEKAVRP